MITKEAAKRRAKKAQKTIAKKNRHPCHCCKCIDSRYRFSHSGACYALYLIEKGETVQAARKECDKLFRFRGR